MKSFQLDGVWWDPHHPGTQRSGRLRFNQSSGEVLTLIVPTDRPVLSPALEEYDLLHGLTTDGKRVTLLGCFDRFTQGHLTPVPRRLEVFANAVIVGFHSAERDPPISGATVSINHLTEWWGRSAIEADQTTPWPSMAARYTPPASVVFYEDGRVRVELQSALAASVGEHQALLREDIRLRLRPHSPEPISYLQGVAQACCDFLSIACLTLCRTTELTLDPSSDQGQEHEGTYHAVPLYAGRDASSRRATFMLFQFRDIEQRAADIMGTWLAQAERLATARTLYLAGVYGGGFIETKLLALTQAAEAFHRRYHPGFYMDEAAFKTTVLAPLEAAIPPGIESSLRDALRSRLRFGNEYSQRRRLLALVAEHRETLRLLVDEPEDYVSPIIDHRNRFTHFPAPPSEARASNATENPERVLLYNWILRLLLECCFLKVMGIRPEETHALVARSELYRQMSRRLRSAWLTAHHQ